VSFAPAALDTDFTTRYRKHCVVVATLRFEGLYGVDGWTPAAFTRYAELDKFLEDKDVLAVALALGGASK